MSTRVLDAMVTIPAAISMPMRGQRKRKQERRSAPAGDRGTLPPTPKARARAVFSPSDGSRTFPQNYLRRRNMDYGSTVGSSASSMLDPSPR
jgi:hypothetical protein